MEMYQDGVRVWNCIGYCSADVEQILGAHSPSSAEQVVG